MTVRPAPLLVFTVIVETNSETLLFSRGIFSGHRCGRRLTMNQKIDWVAFLIKFLVTALFWTSLKYFRYSNMKVPISPQDTYEEIVQRKNVHFIEKTCFLAVFTVSL